MAAAAAQSPVAAVEQVEAAGLEAAAFASSLVATEAVNS